MDPTLVATISRNQPQRITILGGVEAIGTDVEELLAERALVRRIGGRNRFETAALIAALAEPTSTVLVASAGNFPDALTAGAVAAGQKIPILLTDGEGPIADSTSERLQSSEIDQVIVVGGEQALSGSVLGQIEDIVGAGKVQRVGGPNRFATAVELARYAADNYDFANGAHVNLARADDFPDALALGPHAGLDFPGPSPILLTGPDELSTETADYLAELQSCDFQAIHVAGGSMAIGEQVELEARDTLRPDDCGDDITPGPTEDPAVSPQTITATPVVASNALGEPHVVTAVVGPDGAEGTVTFTADDTSIGAATPVPADGERQTQGGSADFVFTSDTAGQVVITARVEGADGTVLTTTAQKYFCGDVSDLDGDGICDEFDSDLDGDGVVDAADIDDDNDGVPDDADQDPRDPDVRFIDANGNGIADADNGISLFALIDGAGESAEGNSIVEVPLTESGPLTPVAQYVVVDQNDDVLLTALVAIDERPSTGDLYVLGEDGTLYTLELELDQTPIDPEPEQVPTGTATATEVGTGDFSNTSFAQLDGRAVGFDFNPQTGSLRIVSREQNFRITMDDLDDGDGTLTVLQDGDLAYGVDDANATAVPNVTAVAQTSNDRGPGAAPSQLYDLDLGNELLALQSPADEGTLATVGVLVLDDGIADESDLNGFDVSGLSGAAYAAVPTSAGSDLALYNVDLQTGDTQLIETFINASINGFTLVPTQ